MPLVHHLPSPFQCIDCPHTAPHSQSCCLRRSRGCHCWGHLPQPSPGRRETARQQVALRPTAVRPSMAIALQWQHASQRGTKRCSAADAGSASTAHGGTFFLFVRLFGVVSLRLSWAPTWQSSRYVIGSKLVSVPALCDTRFLLTLVMNCHQACCYVVRTGMDAVRGINQQICCAHALEESSAWHTYATRPCFPAHEQCASILF